MTIQTTNTPMGQDAISSIRGTITVASNYHTGSRNLLSRRVWLPRWLAPVAGKPGELAPLNDSGCLIGTVEPTKVKRGWRVAESELELSGLKIEQNEPIDLWQVCGAPWQSENALRSYITTLEQVFKIKAIKRHDPRLGVIAGA